MLVTFLKWFLDEMPAYAQPTHLIFGKVKNIASFSPQQKSSAYTDISFKKRD